MAEEWNQDRLEEFFKGHLGEYQEDPGDAMWGEISLHIPPKPVPSWWLFLKKMFVPLLATAVPTVLIFAFLQHKKINQLSQRMEAQSHQIEHLKTQLESYTDLETPFEEVEKESLSPVQNKESLNQTFLLKNSHKSLFPIVKNQQKNTLRAEQKIKTGQASQFLEAARSKETQSPISSVQLLSRQDAGQLARLSVQRPALLKTDVPQIGRTFLENKKKDGPQFFYAAYFEILQAGFSDPIYQSDQSGVSKKYNQTNNGYGIHAGIQLNEHWSVQSGFGLRNFRFHINDAIVFNFDDADGQLDQEENLLINYTYPETGPLQFTTLGKHQIFNDGEDLENGDNFLLFVNANYQLSYYNLPLWMHYQFGQNRLHFRIGAGLNYHFLQGDKSENLQADFSDGRAENLGTRIELNGLKPSFLELGLEAGVHYDLNEKWILGLQWTTLKTIQPMYNSVQPWSYGLKTQLSYRF